MILSEEEINEVIGKEWGADLSKHPLPDRVKRMCNVVVKAQLKKVLKRIETRHKIYNYAVIAGGRKEDTYTIFISQRDWQALSEEVKE